MTDVASLGIVVDSSQVNKATRELRSLTTAANAADRAINSIGSGGGGGGGGGGPDTINRTAAATNRLSISSQQLARTLSQTTSITTRQNQANARIGPLMNGANRSVRSYLPTMNDYALATARAEREQRRLRAAAERAAATQRRLANEAERAGRRMGPAAQKANAFGLQLQDVAVQAQMGTSAFIIVGQQASQLLGVFGAKGALLGAVVAMGAAFGGVLWAATRKANDKMKELRKTADELAGSLELVTSIAIANDAINDLSKDMDTMNLATSKAAKEVVGFESEINDLEREIDQANTILEIRADYILPTHKDSLLDLIEEHKEAIEQLRIEQDKHQRTISDAANESARLEKVMTILELVRKRLAAGKGPVSKEHVKATEEAAAEAKTYTDRLVEMAATTGLTAAEVREYEAAQISTDKVGRMVIKGLLKEIEAKEALEEANKKQAATDKKDAAQRTTAIKALMKASQTRTEVVKADLKKNLALVDSFTKDEVKLYGDKETIKANLETQAASKLKGIIEQEQKERTSTINSIVSNSRTKTERIIADYEEELAFIKSVNDEELMAFGGRIKIEEDMERNKAAKIKDIRDSLHEDFMRDISDSISAVEQLGSSLIDVRQAVLANSLASMEKEAAARQKESDVYQGYTQDQMDIAMQRGQMVDALTKREIANRENAARRAFDAEKAWSIGAIALNTAVGVAKALATGGPLKWVEAAAIAASGAAGAISAAGQTFGGLGLSVPKPVAPTGNTTQNTVNQDVNIVVSGSDDPIAIAEKFKKAVEMGFVAITGDTDQGRELTV